MLFVLDTKGLRLSRQRGSFVVTPPTERGQPRRIGARRLTSIAVTANVTIEAAAIRLAIANEIPLLFFDRIGQAEARFWSPYFASIATLRRQQVRFADTAAASEWMINLFALKTNGQIANLKHLLRRRSREADRIQRTITDMEHGRDDLRRFAGQLLTDCRNQMMGAEGQLARRYWPAVGRSLTGPGHFTKRSRRPAADPFNAALNYAYGMLYATVEGACFAAGLDPHLGFLHADEYRKPTLAFDLIEPFRPWLDRLLIDLFVDGELQDKHFTRNQHGLHLNKTGKAVLIPGVNDYLAEDRRFLGQQASRRNHVYRLARQLAQRIRAAADPDPA